MAAVGVPRALAPLRTRSFRLLVTGQLASNLGDACYAVALPWYVLAAHGGTVLLGTVLAAYGIPRTAAIAVGGWAADRWRPQAVMLATDAVRTVVLAVLAAVAVAGPARAVMLVPVAVVAGAAEGLFLPASFTIVPSVIPGEELQAANALSSGGTQLATLAGPAIGGALVALAGPALTFAVDAASFAVSAVTLAMMAGRQVGAHRAAAAEHPPTPATAATPPIPATAPAPATPPIPATPVGPATSLTQADLPIPATAPAPADHGPRSGRSLLALFRAERVLLVMLLINIAANLGSGGESEVALPALAHGPLHAGAAGYGFILAAFGGGALVGTIVVGQVTSIRRPAFVGSLAFLGDAVFVGLAPYLGSTAAVAAAMAAFGIANGFANVLTITAFQRWAPPALRGRLLGLVLLTSFGSFPLSVALAAATVNAFGPAPFFVFAAVALAAAILAGLTQRSWREFGATAPSSTKAEPDKHSERVRVSPDTPHDAAQMPLT